MSMKNYTAEGESGHTIILHGRRAAREYERDVEAGKAEPIIPNSLRPGMERGMHEYLRECGQCYGPCSLGPPR